MTTENSVTIIIPAYNEATSIGKIVTNIKAHYPEYDILVVDDGSTDETALEAQTAGAEVVSHPYNIGNGAAIKTGIRKARQKTIVFMDADGQHDIDDIGRLIEQMAKYDMVVGARTYAGQASLGRAIGNKLFNWLSSYVAKFQVLDLTSGFRAIQTDLAREYVYLLPNSYSYPTTLTLAALRNGNSLKYIPIQASRRKSGKSNIKVFRDGVRFFMIITKICTLFSPMRVFLPISFSMFLLGSINYGYTYITEGRFTNMSALLYVTAILIFMQGLISEQICQMRFERSITREFALDNSRQPEESESSQPLRATVNGNGKKQSPEV